MSNVITETFYGSGREPQWLVESPPREPQSHFDRRGCVRQIRTTTSSHGHSIGHNQSENDLPTRSTTSRHSGAGPMPSAVRAVADRQAAAYVYKAVPASLRTVVERPPLNELDAVFNVPIVEFEVPMCCGKCEEKVKEELENHEGVYKVVCDLHNQRVTVATTSDPQELLKRVKRIKKRSHFWKGSTHWSTANVDHVQYRAPDQYRSHKPSPWAKRHSQQGALRSHINHVTSMSREYSTDLEPGVALEAPQYLMKRKAAGDADPEPYYNHSTTGSAELYQLYSKSASPSTYRSSVNVYDAVPEMYDVIVAGTPFVEIPSPWNCSESEKMCSSRSPSLSGLSHLDSYPWP